MLRVICFGNVHDRAAIPDIIAAARRMYAEDPDIIRGEIAASMHLWTDRAPHPDYSWVCDFADEEAWHRAQKSEAHDRFIEIVRPHLSSAMITQYEIND
jgi:hypothetical protein